MKLRFKTTTTIIIHLIFKQELLIYLYIYCCLIQNKSYNLCFLLYSYYLFIYATIYSMHIISIDYILEAITWCDA
jgi:hypothetical protein